VSASPEGESLFRRFLREPVRGTSVAIALARGAWVKVWYPLIGVRFRAGRRLRIHGRLTIRGPGQVTFGDNVQVLGHCTPFSYTRDAHIRVGSNVILGSVKFGCALGISIGDECIVAESSISDTDHHATRVDRRSPNAPIRILAVTIERNVWIGRTAAVLPGVVVGENSVVAHGAVCMRSVPANMIVVGNPAKVAAPVPPVPAIANDSEPVLTHESTRLP
jgi:acetyltransferase-like isoleucine patch superfamily enzyme